MDESGAIASIFSLWQLWLFIVFVLIVAWAFRPKNKRRLERYGEIPLRDDDPEGKR